MKQKNIPRLYELNLLSSMTVSICSKWIYLIILLFTKSSVRPAMKTAVRS